MAVFTMFPHSYIVSFSRLFVTVLISFKVKSSEKMRRFGFIMLEE